MKVIKRSDFFKDVYRNYSPCKKVYVQIRQEDGKCLITVGDCVFDLMEHGFCIKKEAEEDE